MIAPSDASIEVSVQGTPADPGIGFTAFLQDHVRPFNRAQGPVSIGGSMVFSNLGAGFTITTGIQGLDTHRCTVSELRVNGQWFGSSDSLKVTTVSGVQTRVNFNVICESALLRLNVMGLPPGDSATVIVSGLAEAGFPKLLRVSNGISTYPVLPDSFFVSPGPSRPSSYVAQNQRILAPSRQTTTVDLNYQPSPISPCSHLRPVAWYTFDDGSASDASGKGNGGTVLGATAAPDRSGSTAALSFDGIDDAVDLGDRFNTLQLPFTVAAWVYQPASARADLRAIFATDDEPGRYAGIWFQIEPNGLPQITYADGGPTNAPFRRTLSATTAIPADTWVHVAATVRGPTDMTLYIDGAEVPGTYSGTGGPLVHTSAPARIGSMQFVPANRPWLGLLDEVRVYDCSLPASEIAELFAR